MQLIVKEITGYNADVVCLQEVDRKVFDSDLKPVMAEHGFEGAMDLKGGQGGDSIAFSRLPIYHQKVCRKVR